MKRRRIVIASDSDDSGDEYKPGKDEISDEDESMPSDVESEEDSPQPKVRSILNSIQISKTKDIVYL